MTISVPVGDEAGRVCISKCETLAMDGTASPRNPKVFNRSRSTPFQPSLLVAWRSGESSASSFDMPLPIVLDADQAASAVAELDLDAGRAGIERILDQFLHDRRGAFNHLAGGDLIGNPVGKNADDKRACREMRAACRKSCGCAAKGLSLRNYEGIEFVLVGRSSLTHRHRSDGALVSREFFSSA